MTADANLHIEFESATQVKLYQKTTGTEYDLINNAKNTFGKTTDVDLQALVYPKHIKVTCKTIPTFAVITFAE